ncbi:unnamed protein product, partial [Ascophyllum nodosum]
DDAYTGPLFTLWEGLYRRSTIPVGALCVVYENPVRDLHGLCLYVPYGTYTRRIVSGFDL